MLFGLLAYACASMGAMYVFICECPCDGTIKSGNAMARVSGFALALLFGTMIWAVAAAQTRGWS